MKVVILGYGQMLMNLIAGCMDANCEIVGVLRHDKVRLPIIDRLIIDCFNPSKEFNYIKSHNLYELKARSANSVEFKKEILRLNADIILVGSWSEKIKKHIIDLPKFATINVHPSLLPKYRGPNPYLQAIKNMEKESGVTFHLMDEDYDTGAILHQKTVKIEQTDTGAELRPKIAQAAREGVCELLHKLDTEIIIPVKQDEKKASYFPNITESDVILDFSKTAEELSAQIRGFHPWTKCYFAYNRQYFVPNARKLEMIENNSSSKNYGEVVDKSYKEKSITVACGDGKLLKMSGVKLYGFLKLFTGLYIRFFVKK